jgi:hypothetical protein
MRLARGWPEGQVVSPTGVLLAALRPAFQTLPPQFHCPHFFYKNMLWVLVSIAVIFSFISDLFSSSSFSDCCTLILQKKD